MLKNRLVGIFFGENNCKFLGAAGLENEGLSADWKVFLITKN
jgi:hypothetical protein